MAKRKDIEWKSAAPSGDAITTAPEIETKPVEPAGDALKIEATAAPVAAAKDELPAVEAPKLAEIRAVAEEDRVTPTSLPPSAAETPVAAPAPARVNRFALLAASVAVAAAIGAMGGALGASGLMRPAVEVVEAAPMPTMVAESRALQGAITQLRSDLSALKTSIDAGTKSTNAQFAKVTERFDRVERAQADPAAKIAKAVEALERLEKRVDATVARDTTGSVPSPQPAVATAPTQPPQAPIVTGWIVRDVYRGTAMIQGRFGMIEVEAGDTVPGVGRVEAIRKQDGRWVVVTSRGLIPSGR